MHIDSQLFDPMSQPYLIRTASDKLYTHRFFSTLQGSGWG